MFAWENVGRFPIGAAAVGGETPGRLIASEVGGPAAATRDTVGWPTVSEGVGPAAFTWENVGWLSVSGRFGAVADTLGSDEGKQAAVKSPSNTEAKAPVRKGGPSLGSE